MSRVQGKTGGTSRQRSSQQAPEGAVFSGSVGAGAGGLDEHLLPADRCCLSHTGEKPQAYKCKQEKPRGAVLAARSVPSSLPGGLGSTGLPPRPRPGCSSSCPAASLYLPLTCQVFLLFVFLKELWMWGHHRGGRTGCTPRCYMREGGLANS